MLHTTTHCYMKLTPFIITAACSISTSLAMEVWAPGVSLESGWVDYNKEDGSYYYNDDSGMCWAATASNVITWWQTLNADTLTANKVELPDETPWDVFRQKCPNYGSNPRYAYGFWINGTWDGIQVDKNFTPSFNANGGYLKDVYNTTLDPIFIQGSDSSDVYTKAASLVGALEDGYALSIEVGTNDGTSSHAITLWGLDYHLDGENIILDYAYITDSDSGYGLTKAQFEPYGKGFLILKSTTTGTGNSYKFNRADGMRSELLPEPTTSTLSILALVALGLRRRRR